MQKKASSKKASKRAVKKSNNNTTNKAVKKAVSKRAVIQLAECDKNYFFEAKNSFVKNDYQLLTSDIFENSFASQYCSTEYIKQNQNCLNFANYNESKNNCITCVVSDICKTAKLSENSFASIHIESKAKRTICKESMINEIILSLFTSRDKESKKALITRMSRKYDKREQAVKSKVNSFSCVLNHLTIDNFASDSDKIVKKYCSYLMLNYKVQNFVIDSTQKSSTAYCDKAFTLLKAEKLI